MDSNRFSCFVIGDGTLAQQCAEILLRSDHDLLGIVSAHTAIERWAEENGIPHREPASDLNEFLGAQSFDYLFSIANLRILPDDIVRLPRKGAINFHDALLPRYAGLHATSWALMNREKTHGITWHLMTGEVDSGDILKQRDFKIGDRETAFSLNAKCYEAAIESFAELIKDMAAGRTTAVKQNPAERTYFSASKRPVGASVISWEADPRDIVALVRALDFGPYPNPLGMAKIVIGSQFVVASKAAVLDFTSESLPGTVTGIAPDSITVATSGRDVKIHKVLSADGQALSIPQFIAKFGLHEGYRLTQLDQDLARRASELDASVSQHETFWVERLAAQRSIKLPYFESKPASLNSAQQYESVLLNLPEELDAFIESCGESWSRSDFLLAVYAAYVARISGADNFDLGFREVSLSRAVAGLEQVFASTVPVRIEANAHQSAMDFLNSVRKQLETTRRRKTHARDVALRYPSLRTTASSIENSWSLTVEHVDTLTDEIAIEGQQLTLVIAEDAAACRLVYETSVLDGEKATTIAGQFTNMLSTIITDPDCKLATLPLLNEVERQRVLVDWNQTATSFPADQCVHQLFETQVELTPDVIAIVFEDEQLTYRELNGRANQLARHLRSLNVGPDVLVGLHLERSLDMMVGLLGILKAGGAYVPLDPTYPQERLSLMLDDSRAPIVITQNRLKKNLPARGAHVISIDGDWATTEQEEIENVNAGVAPTNLAYVIYTSGSTGKPKGVMVEHRNVVNFFTAMDERIGDDAPGTWLAVTSISFDISVLELFWTLTRGFKVVIHSDDDKAIAAAPQASSAAKQMDFSLFYFASDDAATTAGDKYRLLIEGARFADQHGFKAIWTPERHFHPFGGLYPNPSVTSAFLAGITERIQLRAGSVVLPLHNSIRVAEEWSVVDNLSQGRVGVSFASGWHDRDFAFAPEHYADRKEVMRREIDTVRKLWRGEAITCRGGMGNDVELKIFPRPVQHELPIWITAAGGPETFQLAGELGANVLTHLLFQSPQEIAQKIAVYREAWRKAGHGPEGGHVTIMLHTFVGSDVDQVRELVRKPFTEYLRSSVDLIKKLTMGAGNELSSKDLTDDDHEALLAHAFERYFETSGLFGTPQTCDVFVARLKEIGVDEIACLIDFGVEVDAVLDSFSNLDQLRRQGNELKTAALPRTTLPEQLAKHNITHMQCTPSTARMLTTTSESLASLGSLRKLMLGGEALPTALARQLKDVVSGDVYNMYGPTETTIWSTVHPLEEVTESIPIGRPIANTEIYILDKNLQPVPVGVAGELMIGGAGVVRGYFNRPDLTAERFIQSPFTSNPQNRLYRTGDLARYLPDGTVEFLGRMDNQVKVRGYRIELGEIETALERHPAVKAAVAQVFEPEPGDKRLVAYLTKNGHAAPSPAELREFLKVILPDYMVPGAFILLDALPLTPNGKVDRRALPEAGPTSQAIERNFVAPRNDVEETLAAIWIAVLKLERVGVDDNFFELGGDSILAVQIVARASQSGLPISVRNLLDRQTVAELAAAIEPTPMSAGLDEAEEGFIALSPAQQSSLESDGVTREFTPADFPLANLTQEKLNKLSQRLVRRAG